MPVAARVRADRDPMWIGNTVYFNSDRGGTFNLYAYDITTSDIRLYSQGSHEIMINYRIKLPKIHAGIPCPSYW